MRISDWSSDVCSSVLPSQYGSALAPRAVKIVFDFDDGRHGIARLAEKFHTDGAGVRRHAVQDPACRRDQAVAAFFLCARPAGQKLERKRDVRGTGGYVRVAHGGTRTIKKKKNLKPQANP